MGALPEGIVAFLLTDLEGSTRAWEAKPDAMHKVMAQHDGIVTGSIERHGGVVVESGRAGDSVMAAFQNTAGAARTAIDIQREIAAAEWPDDVRVGIRIAIPAGEAQVRGGHYYGQALNRCARLLAVCHPGQILLSKATQEILIDQLTEDAELWDLGLHRLKDLKRPERIFQLVDLASPAHFPPIRSQPHELTNLPIPLTTFVGRQEELRRLRRLEAGARLLTLTGPGGGGKTRLALELGAQLVSNQTDGVWFADLAPVMDSRLVPHAVAAGLELQEQARRPPLETIVEHCRDRKLILLLDNCEHLVDACARLAQALITSCPELHIIATSREPLQVPGETVWRVPPLSVSEATRLFLDRAASSAPTYVVPESSLPVVARICERLDGIPLAMELAAARVPMLPVDEILERLEKGLAFLAGSSRTAATRQQTLKATMDWSHGLLEPPEQVLFRRLAVFSGSFSLAACEQICSEPDLPPEATVNLLGQLVSKSLVVAVEGRYRLLDTIRAYALDRLREGQELAAVQAQHARFYLQLAASRQPGKLAEWLHLLEEDHDNFGAALSWAADSDPEFGSQLAGALFQFWLLRGHITEARQTLDQLLQGLGPESAQRRAGLLRAGALAYVAGDFEMAEHRLEDGLARSRSAGDTSGVIRGLYYLGVLNAVRDKLDSAQASLVEALRLSREIRSPHHESEVLHQLGMVASLRGQPDQASSLLQQSLDTWRSIGRPDEAGMTLAFLSAVALTRGEMATARESIRESLEIGLALRDRRSAWSLDVLACLSAAERNGERAMRLAGAAVAMFDATGQRPPAGWYQFTSVFLDPVRRELGPDRSREAWEKGRALNFEAALDYALERDPELRARVPS